MSGITLKNIRLWKKMLNNEQMDLSTIINLSLFLKVDFLTGLVVLIHTSVFCLYGIIVMIKFVIYKRWFVKKYKFYVTASKVTWKICILITYAMITFTDIIIIIICSYFCELLFRGMFEFTSLNLYLFLLLCFQIHMLAC